MDGSTRGSSMYRPYHRQWQRQLKHVAAFLSACCCGVVPFRVVNLKVTMKALFQGKWQFIRVHGNTGTFDPPFSHYQSAATETITSHLTATMAWDDHQSELLLREIDAWQNHQNLKRRWHDWHYGMWWMLLRKLHLSKVNRYAANSFVTETIFFYGHFSCCTMQSRSLWQHEFTNKISWRRWLDQVKLTATWSNIASMSVRSPVTKTLWPVSHVNPMGSAKDTKQDDLVDMQEFAEWLTNVNATITVGLLASKLRRPWVIPF